MKNSLTGLRIACVARLVVALLAVASTSVVVAQVETKSASEPDEATLRKWVGQLKVSERGNEYQQHVREIGGKARAAVPTLISMLKSNNEDRQIDALLILQVVGSDAKDSLPAIRPLLTVRGTRLEYLVRFNAAIALAKVGGDVKPVMPMLMAAVEGTDPKARGMAMWSFGEIGPEAKEAVPAMLKVLKVDARNERINAIVSLGKIGPPAEKAIPALMDLATASGIWYPGIESYPGSSANRCTKELVQQALAQITGKAEAIPPSEYELFYRGSQLSAERVAEMEAKLQQNPQDLDIRLQLIGGNIAVVVKRESPPAELIQAARQKLDDLVTPLRNTRDAIAVRRDLYLAEEIFRKGDLDLAESALRPVLERWELLVKTHAELATDSKTLGEGLWAIMVWRKIYELKEQISAKEFPLKWLWEKEAHRIRFIKQEFATAYGPFVEDSPSSVQATARMAGEPLDPVEFTSSGGATLKKLDDVSLLVSGTNPAKDTYVITAESDLPKITGLRLEVFKHDSLPSRGPGRLHNGTFILTRVEVKAGPKGSNEALQPITLTKATADFTQQGHSVANLIDGKPGPGWAIWNNGTQHRRVDFQFDKPLAFESGAKLTITLKHESVWEEGNLGCFRLSVTTSDGSHVGGAPSATPNRRGEKIDPRAVVTKADVESVMGRAVDAPTMQGDSTCIYRTLPQHYNVEVGVLSGSTAARFQSLRDISAKGAGMQVVDGLGEEAYWVPNNYRLSVRKGDVELHITTVLPVKEQTKAGQDAARVQRKEAAIILARKAVERIAKGQTTYIPDPKSVARAEPKPRPEPDEATIRQWVEQLTDKDQSKASGAIQQLRILGPKARLAVPKLIEMLKSNDLTQISNAILLLPSIGPEAKAAAPALLPFVNQKDGWSIMRLTAAHAYWQVSRDAKPIMPLLIESLAGDDKFALTTATGVLSHIGPDAKDAVPGLIIAIKHPQSETRNNAVIALGNIGAAADQATAALTAATDGPKFPGSTSELAKKALEQIAVHRELTDGEKHFRNGDIDASYAKLESGLKRYEQMLKTHPQLASDGNTLDQGLWALVLWQTVYQLKNSTQPKDFPLKSLWEKEAARVTKIRREFNRQYGPP